MMPAAMAAGIPEETTYRSLGEREVELARTVEAGMLPRLAGLGAIETSVVVHLWFYLDSRMPGVKGNARVRMKLPCQWCTEQLSRDIEARFDVLLAADEAEATSWDERVGQDRVIVVAGERLDVPSLIEDELMLSVPARVCVDEACPMRPKHAAGAHVTTDQSALAGLAKLLADDSSAGTGSGGDGR